MSLFDLGFAVGMMATHDVLVKRYNASTYDANGRAVARSTAFTVTVRGSVQPIAGADLKRVAEGFNVTDLRSVWLTGMTVEVQNGDELTIGSERFQVEHVNEWSAAGNYARVTAHKLDAREI